MRFYYAVLIATAAILLSRFVSIGFFKGAVFDFAVLVALPIIFLVLYKVNLKDVLLSFGNLKLGLKLSLLLFAVALPIMAYGSTLSDFSQYYPIWKQAHDSIPNLIMFESMIAIRMFATEFFYRGFLLWTLMGKLDERYANLIHSFIYMLMHIGKPMLEVPYSFIAGYVFAWVDLRSKSILPSFLMHFLASLVFDLMIVYL